MRLLVVDDDAELRSLLVRALERDRHRVVAVDTVEAAREALKKGGIDLIVLDLALPDASGIDLCREMGMTRNPVPVLMLTAHAEVSERVRALDAGADDFLGTAQPWPTLNVNRQQMLDLDKAVVAMDTEWIRVCAHQFGDTVITVGYVRYNREDFQGEAPIGEGMPAGADIAKQTKGKVAAYLNGWRFNGERWQVFDHHLIQLLPDVGF